MKKYFRFVDVQILPSSVEKNFTDDIMHFCYDQYFLNLLIHLLDTV